jgi:hypothetical protein
MYSEGMQIDRPQLEQNFRDLSDEDQRSGCPIEVAPGHGPLKICVRDVNPMNAQVLAACLQNAGLAARVMVAESQVDAARTIRAAIDAGELAIDEDYDVGRGS